MPEMIDGPSDDSIAVLRSSLGPTRTTEDAMFFVAGFSRLAIPGSALLVLVDEDRLLLDIVTVVDGAEHPHDLVRFAWLYSDARSIFLAVNRTGQAPADRPDDELTWLELRGQATAADLVLLDWFVVWGTKAFSIAEHAPAPAAW